MSLTPTAPDVLALLQGVQDDVLSLPQVEVQTEHIIHGGMYARTIRLAADVVLVGALIKIPTLLLVVGRTAVFVGDGWIELEGTHVIPASAGRKQVFITREPTSITMTFATDATTVEQAEQEFTDDHELLASKHSANDVVTITGE